METSDLEGFGHLGGESTETDDKNPVWVIREVARRRSALRDRKHGIYRRKKDWVARKRGPYNLAQKSTGLYYGRLYWFVKLIL